MVNLSDREASVCQPRRKTRRVIIAGEVVACLSIVLYTLIRENIVGQSLKASLFSSMESKVAARIDFFGTLDLILSEA